MKKEERRKQGGKRKSFRRDKRAFTGLEAAIVLTAFVVVAAVFSYVILNAGFFTTEKSKEAVHKGMEKTSRATEIAGDIIAKENSSGFDGRISNITVPLALSTGGTAVHIGTGPGAGNLIVTYTDPGVYASNASWTRTFFGNDTDEELEYGEKVEITVTVPSGAYLDANATAASCKFTITIQPPEAPLTTVEKRTPATIDTVMVVR